MSFTRTAVPTLPVAVPSQMFMPMKQNVTSLSPTVSMALTGMAVASIIDRKQMQLKSGGPVVAQLKPLISKSMSLEDSRFTTYRLNTPRGKNHASVICLAALSSQCAAAQAQTVRRKSPTITIAAPKGGLKPPELDRGGSGKPPHGGGGGGGGGGGQFSGGFFLFGFLLFLSYWKDKETSGEYAEKRRQKLHKLWRRVYQLQ